MLGQQLTIEPFLPNAQVALSSISLTVDLFIKKEGTKVNLDGEELTNFFKETFAHQVFTARQQLALNFNGSKLDVMVESLDHAEIPGVDGIASPLHARREGQVLPTTQMKWHAPTGNRSVIISKAGADATDVKKDLFRSDFNFEQMGIGGLDEQFKKMFRTAFASRMFPGVVKELGTNHVRGILLYGPPGICFS